MRNVFSLILPVFFAITSFSCSQTQTERLEPLGTNPPKTWAVAVTNVRPHAVRISWTTDRPATSDVFYGVQGSTRIRRRSDAEPARIHIVELDSLKTGTAYEFRVGSGAADGSRGVSEPGTFTPREMPPRGRVKFDGTTLLGAVCGIPEIVQAAGMSIDRFDSGWYGLMPKPHEWDRKRLDAYAARVRAFRAAGIETLVTLDYCVRWAQKLTETQASWRHPAFGPPDHVADWKEYCRGIMTALADAPQWYEIWNEPDAGYLASPLGPGGKQRWAPEGWQPVVDPEFQKNTRYWIQDRYAPMVLAAREVAEEIGADARIMAAGWNHDYHGSRGEMLMQLGVDRAIDAYSFHCYVGKPLSFEGWRRWFDTYLQHIDRIFTASSVDLPLVMTEYGIENFGPAPGDLVSPQDRAVQIAKATLLALARHRFIMLCMYNLAGGEMALADEASLPLKPRPMFHAYKHIVERFSRRQCEPFDALTVESGGAKVDPPGPQSDLWWHAFRFPETGEVFVAAWQGIQDGATKLPKALPARTAAFRAPPPSGGGTWRLYRVDLNGGETPFDAQPASDGSLLWSAQLPATTPDHETEPTYFVLKCAKFIAH